LCFGVTFVCLLRWLQNDSPGIRLAAITGLAVAATYLTKISNLPLVVVALAVVGFKTWRLAKAASLRSSFPTLGVFALCALLPIVAWVLWCKYSHGDFTGTAEKIDYLGWTRKPVGAWWPHPIFSVRGLLAFWPELMASFWRGEFVWFHQRLAS